MKNLDSNSPIEQQVLAAIQMVIGPGPIGLHEPTFDGNELMYLKECLDSTYVSSVGKFVDQFEVTFTGSMDLSKPQQPAAFGLSLGLGGGM